MIYIGCKECGGERWTQGRKFVHLSGSAHHLPRYDTACGISVALVELRMEMRLS
jgi:hypothetical protein